ncbi:c-type cytochrome [Carboxylicivirga caseinilyticus]|uniref:c-type cytochrome n=1 Tax=Carboxylicivirga caseinilyticus TaxID=3417572 RepID=UPI003D3435AC|nr:cytochrome c [Marinilabiliaceae bacterium A049]
MKNLLYLFLMLPFVFACSESTDDKDIVPEVNEEYNAAKNYFTNTLQPVITANCVSCHTGHHSQSNSSNYGVLANAINSATSMYNMVNSGNMPKDAAKLSQTDIDKFAEFKNLVDAIE